MIRTAITLKLLKATNSEVSAAEVNCMEEYMPLIYGMRDADFEIQAVDYRTVSATNYTVIFGGVSSFQILPEAPR